MYTLYFDKNKAELKLTKASKGMQKFVKYTEEATRHNSCCYVCLNRKPLKELAESMKQEWINETEDILEKCKNIKI